MTRPALTGTQTDALAAYLVTLRPGQRRWTKTAVYDALTAAAAKFTPDAETLTRAALRAALSSNIISPEVIAMPGEHWESVSSTPVHEPSRARLCHICGTFHLPGAAADCRPVVLSQATSEHAAAVKKQIRKLRKYDQEGAT